MNFKIKIIIILIGFFIINLFNGCKNSGSETKDSEVSKEKVKLPYVKYTEVKSSVFKENIKIIGIIKPYAAAKISSEEGGLITYLSKDKGSYVRKGEVIARIKKDVELATYQQTEAQVELARMNYEKQKQLFEENATTEIQYLTAKWQYEAAVRSLNILKTRLRTGFIRSPINGFVSEKYMNKGEMSAPGSPIINVIDISSVKVSAGVPEKYIENIKLGQTVKITIDVLPQLEFTGKINFIAPNLSATNRTLEIEIVIQNKGNILKPEMNANVEITQTTNNDAIVLPQDYIIDFGDNNKYVFVLEGDTAKKRMITIGGRDGNNVLISSGLYLGDKLIYEGFQQLSDNDKVQILQ
jgi:RND family efflux transporter MFP subunit